MLSMKNASLPLVIALTVLAGCGNGAASSAGGGEQPAQAPAADPQDDARAKKADAAKRAAGVTVTLGDSEFGRMLFSSEQQAIYIFERDDRDRSNCYGECAEAWPPVVTEGSPVAGEGVDGTLLGTTKRRDGTTQVTYAGKPLYFYAHEGPGEVRCHDVNLNGGFWWAVGADGERLP